MNIYVDADACPVVRQVEKIAQKYTIPVFLFCDTNHILISEYAQVNVIGAGTDAVDFAIVSKCKAGDIVVTQDFGVAAMILGKGAYGIHQSGKWFTNENIDILLGERHLARKERRSSNKHHLKGPGKRTREDNLIFEDSLERLINSIK